VGAGGEKSGHQSELNTMETPAEKFAGDAPQSILERFAPLFSPRSIAVVGASASGTAAGNAFIRLELEFGFTGGIYPIHPSATSIEGLRAYASISEVPEPVDYAFVSIAAHHVPDVIASMQGRVRFAQVNSSGFGEVAGGAEREHALLAAARRSNVRVIGPNCLGTYSPSGRVTFTDRLPPEPGSIGIVSQSGGLSVDIVLRGKSHGLRFRGLVSIGNGVDVGAAELLEYYLADPETEVIGLYLESAREGRRLFDVLRNARAAKPVVILRGGRTRQGALAAVSHTGALAADERVWSAFARQTGCVFTRTLDEFIDVLHIFQMLTPRVTHPTSRIVLFGNGGGTSVLAADCFAETGLDVAAFEPELQATLAALDLPAGSSVANPIDMPASALQKEGGAIAGRVLEAVFANARPDALVIHLNMTAILNRGRDELLANLINAVKRVQAQYPGRAHVILTLRADGAPAVEDKKRDYRQQLLAAGIPVFDEMPQTAQALAALCAFERFRARRGAA
jgi:acyl-CoA synthetase (NDP forming)